MTKVFIAGPIKIRTIDKNIKDRINNILSQNMEILVGDAGGIDRAVQQYLYECKYTNVTVFCINAPRNNIGNWQVFSVNAAGKTGFSEYIKKDLAMAEAADFGLMIWNGKSNGTLNNTLNLLESGKSTRLYFYPQKQFYSIRQINELKSLLENCTEEDLTLINKKINLFQRVEKLSQGDLFHNDYSSNSCDSESLKGFEALCGETSGKSSRKGIDPDRIGHWKLNKKKE